MPKTLLLVSLLALVLPSQAVAGPPERVSGKMVLDEAADGLRRYRQATTPAERLAWLAKLAPTKDPRVTVALGDAMANPDRDIEERRAAALVLARHLFPSPAVTKADDRSRLQDAVRICTAETWWIANKAEVRRRAEQLPQ